MNAPSNPLQLSWFGFSLYNTYSPGSINLNSTESSWNLTSVGGLPGWLRYMPFAYQYNMSFFHSDILLFHIIYDEVMSDSQHFCIWCIIHDFGI